MQISEADNVATHRAPRGEAWTAIVTDLETGQRYLAWDADCGAQCRCDALCMELPCC